MRLLAELDLAGLAVHGFHNGKALQLDALAADELAALLEALFHGAADADQLGAGGLDDLAEAAQRFAAGEEIVDHEHHGRPGAAIPWRRAA